MKVKTTPEEDKFVGQAARDYYQVAVSVDAFQGAVLRTLREVTDGFDSKLSALGLPFANAREKGYLGADPSVQRKIVRPHLEAGVCLGWLADDDEPKVTRLCAYWWIWLKDRAKREALSSAMEGATKKPFECESGAYGTSYFSLYFPLKQSAHIKEHARNCTAEFVRVLNLSECRKLMRVAVKAKAK